MLSYSGCFLIREILRYCEAGIGICAFVTFSYVLSLHFTFASGIGVGHAGCAEFSFSHSAEFSFLVFSSGSGRFFRSVSQERVSACT